MNENWLKRSDEFLKISGQFKLGALVTEASHPVTANLSEVAKTDMAAGLKRLFDVDADVIGKFREFVESGRAEKITATLLAALKNGGRIFFTGCGSTGRLSILLDSIWRDFWQQQNKRGKKKAESANDFEDRTFSVMAGGDFALIKAVEGFEDFTAFGEKQINDLGVSARDVVFAITEGGETSFVIGTAWAGVAAGAKVYFVYNNPDDLLCEHVQRSREVIQEPRIEKINLTTGPMAITGSTRMQATSIQLCVLLTVLEMVVRELVGTARGAVTPERDRGRNEPIETGALTDGSGGFTAGEAAARRPHQHDELASVPKQFLASFEAAYAGLKSPEFLASLAQLVTLEETAYRAGRKNSYFAGRFGIDVLTDTTERSPTFCTPPFRKFDDDRATESWAFLFLPEDWTDNAWKEILKRQPRCVEWAEAEIAGLVDADKVERTLETVQKISATELMRYKIGSNGVKYRALAADDCAVAVMAAAETAAAQEFQLKQLASARANGAHTGLLFFGRARPQALLSAAEVCAFVPVPTTDLRLDGVTRVVVKLVMNALSTCTMVRLGRVLGNYMVWVVPSNLKLIDRATRYITKLTDLNYEAANRLLFEIIAYVEPRMKADQAYPPVVSLAVLRAKEQLTNEQAEAKLKAGL